MKTASTSTASTPNTADSLGVAQPSRIMPTTQKITSPIGRTYFTNDHSMVSSGGRAMSYCGAALGSILTWTKISTA